MNKMRLVFLLIMAASSGTMKSQSDEELAKKLANPIASLISVPLQNNTDYGIGQYSGSRNTLNIQPVMPMSISEGWNLIGRVILPVVSQYNITGSGGHQSGLSDAVASAFFSPKEAKNGFTWGAGPVILIPTATDDYLGTEKLGAGPTAVFLKQAKGWTYGALVNQIWSFAGNKDRSDVSQMFLQPFLTYNWKNGAGLGANMEMTQNWNSGDTVLWLNPTVSAVTGIGSQKISLVVGPRINIAAPQALKADWGWRAVLIFLFPK